MFLGNSSYDKIFSTHIEKTIREVSMSKKDDVGYGKFTELKIEHLGKIFDMHLAITQAVLRKNPYYDPTYRYIDVTAGKGYIPEGTTLGSPLVFIESSNSRHLDMTCKVDLFECVEENHEELTVNFRNYSQKLGWDKRHQVQFHNDKYQTLLPKFLSTKKAKELGLLFVDHSGDLPDFDTIKYVSKMRPRMEILIYLPARTI